MTLMEALQIIVPSTLFAGAPLILTALGGLFSERTGVINIGLEGLMVMGAFIGATFTLLAQSLGFGALSPWFALLAAAVIGAVYSLIHAVATVTFRSDHIVSGVAINFFAIGFCVFLTKQIYHQGQTPFIDERIGKMNIPILSDIPVIGPLLFQNAYLTSYMAIILAIIAWFVIFKTPFGMRLSAVGESPQAADTMGINVTKMRYIAVMISGAFGGLGGAVYATSIASNFGASTIAGQGFMALAAMIFGKWNPLGAMGAGLFFGFAQSLSVIGGALPFFKGIPQVYLLILPYVITILALAGFIGRSRPPKANGENYIKEGH